MQQIDGLDIKDGWEDKRSPPEREGGVWGGGVGENKETGTHLKSGAQTEQFIRRCNW